ncbi:hypothetical protein K457DRAFT_157300 [Linnemannia elongata AG-77]|uniref:Myb/SANT-like domain-containing protein n=1 Tax=Linnemannia elongata AG-77 TaxID=1314771 RepID=A0A197JR37_9FUNG|nr:hypothetical protein K457DRAFT_157300 [Linnemannia elongata AG-77]
MAKRSRDGSSRQLVPLAIKPTTRAATSAYSEPSTPGSQSEAGLDGYQGTLRPSSFWVQEGMDTFFDWITNPHNHQRLHKKNPVSGQKPKDIRQEIANVVNNKHNTKWTELQVKSKIAYVKSKYRDVAKMNSTGLGAQVVAKQLEVCPEFTRLHEVYGRILAVNPPLPKQSAHFEDGPTTTYEITDDESSDLEPHEDASDTDLNAAPSSIAPPNKRRRGNGISSPAELKTSIERIKQLSEQYRVVYDETKNELRQREQAVETRERELAEKLLRLSDEARVRLREELAAERADFRKEMAEEKAELKEERAELKREKAAFTLERDQLKMELAALRKELEVRTVRWPKNFEETAT